MLLDTDTQTQSTSSQDDKLFWGGRLRFNLVFLALAWLLILIPLIVPQYSLPLASRAVVLFLGLINLVWTIALLLSAKFIWKLFKTRRRHQRTVLHPRVFSNLHHLVTLCVYKEPLELIERTLNTLCNQTQAQQLIVVVGMEARTPEATWKAQVLKQKYQDCFEEFIVTIHPFGLPGEIPGKCSNVNYALRTAVRQLQEQGTLQFDCTTVTTCDSDNLFHFRYFEELSVEFQRSRSRHKTVWQSPLFYNWNLDTSPWFTRITGLLRPIFMMGLLVPFNINTMSVQSLSLKLCIMGDYFHPFYQMDDIIAVVRWMTEIKGGIKIRPLYIPTLSGPTSGHGFLDEFREWRLQARRWTIGAAEVFHYYCTRLGSLPFATAMFWGSHFIAYYCIFLCAAPLVGLFASLKPILYPASDAIPLLGNHTFSSLLLYIGLYQCACFFVVFCFNQWWIRLLDVEEKVSPVKTLLHFCLTPFTVLAYSLVEFIALHEMAIHGKSICGHRPSEKNALARRKS
jgi:hypothetical protein